MFTLLEKNLESMEKEESIAIDYLATDNNWHLSRFIVQSRTEDGTARQVLLVIRVISEEKRREKYLIDAVEEANRANEAKSEFLSRMSHDIRTPMNAIMGFTRVARNHLHEPDKILDCLDKINLSGSNLQQLINDVLDISRIESGEFRIDSEPVKLSELCKLYEQNIRGTAEDKNQKFICNRHDIIYDTVLSDRLRIGQIYMNLLSNAVKYTPGGGTVELEVYEEPFPDKDKIRLVSIVRDAFMMSKKLGKPVIMLAQANREAVKNKKKGQSPELHDLAESDGVAQNATRVISLSVIDGILKLSVKKNRYGINNKDVMVMWDINAGYIKPLLENKEGEKGEAEDYGF